VSDPFGPPPEPPPEVRLPAADREALRRGGALTTPKKGRPRGFDRRRRQRQRRRRALTAIGLIALLGLAALLFVVAVNEDDPQEIELETATVHVPGEVDEPVVGVVLLGGAQDQVDRLVERGSVVIVPTDERTLRAVVAGVRDALARTEVDELVFAGRSGALARRLAAAAPGAGIPPPAAVVSGAGFERRLDDAVATAEDTG
jgi:hypothetical protein